MGIIVNQDEDKNNELTERINADLREKMSETANVTDDPDLAEDTDYTKDLKKTSRFGWVWVVLIILAALALVAIVLI